MFSTTFVKSKFIYRNLKNFDYELIEGCSRQDRTFDPTDINQVGAVDAGYAQKLAADAMFKKEHEEGDRAKAAGEETRVEKVEWIQERMKDDFAANSFLRAQFRNEKKSMNDQRVRDDQLRGKLSIGITKLLPESEEDRKIASMITRYRDVRSHDDTQSSSREKIGSRRIFEASAGDFDEEVPTPSTSTPSSGSTSSAGMKASDRLKATMKLERDKRINETFSTSAGISLGKRKSVASSSLKGLGIVIKSKKQEKEEAPESDEKGSGPSTSSSQAPPPPNHEPTTNAISLISQEYGSTSPSDESE